MKPDFQNINDTGPTRDLANYKKHVSLVHAGFV